MGFWDVGAQVRMFCQAFSKSEGSGWTGRVAADGDGPGGCQTGGRGRENVDTLAMDRWESGGGFGKVSRFGREEDGLWDMQIGL